MRFLLLAFLFLAPIQLTAQVANAEFSNIAKKFEKGSYEAGLETAESVIDNDKHRKKPEPYLWASMCYYQIHLSDDEAVKSRVKSPLRNALKYAGKAASKDKNGNFVEANQEYFNTMKQAGVEEAIAQDADGDYRKAAYTYKQIMNFASDDAFIQFAKAVNDIKMNSYFEAERELREAFPALEESYRDMDFEPDPISLPLLKPRVVYYINHLVENAYQDSAKKVTMAARVFFPLDEEIKQKLESLE